MPPKEGKTTTPERIRKPISHLNVENALRLEAGVMKVKVLVSFFVGRVVSGVVEKRGYLLPKLLPRLAGLKQRSRQVHLLLHEFLHFICVRIFEPGTIKSKKIKKGRKKKRLRRGISRERER